MADIQSATRDYEAWLAGQLDLIESDLAFKHEQMATAPFAFLRATFYRWMSFWKDIASDFSDSPVVLSVGDLHIENFGTWRDQEGRLIWGISDFDEAYPLPWTQDLIRLATSAHLAVRAKHLSLNRQDACDAILEGYGAGLREGGKPFVLAEEHSWLRRIALDKLRDPLPFWEKIERNAVGGRRVPPGAVRALRRALAAAAPKELNVLHRIAGLGSLGRQRLVVCTDWNGAKICREAKAIAPSACAWVRKKKPPHKTFHQELLDTAIRAPDPFVQLSRRWIVRRLAPDCTRIDLADISAQHDERRFLHSMGYETANVHLGSKGAQTAILRDFRKRQSKWLHEAAKRALLFVINDWKSWAKFAHPPSS